MAINPINIATMARTQDFSTIKQNEDNRATMTQMTMSMQEDKKAKIRSGQVVKKEETRWHQKKFDAREKGDNEYSGDGGKNRQAKQISQVVPKKSEGFDVKI